jgi:hypothetical protein
LETALATSAMVSWVTASWALASVTLAAVAAELVSETSATVSWAMASVTLYQIVRWVGLSECVAASSVYAHMLLTAVAVLLAAL